MTDGSSGSPSQPEFVSRRGKEGTTHIVGMIGQMVPRSVHDVPTLVRLQCAGVEKPLGKCYWTSDFPELAEAASTTKARYGYGRWTSFCIGRQPESIARYVGDNSDHCLHEG